MPSQTDLYLEWNSDFVLTPGGSLQLASGWDVCRQRIVRNLITNSAQTLPDGTMTAPDYIWHPDYGLGLGTMVGQNISDQEQQDIVAKTTKAVQSDVSTLPGAAPKVTFSKGSSNTTVVGISVPLSNTQTGKIAVTMT